MVQITIKDAVAMKKCNICKCIVDETSECPICGNNLTYETPIAEYKEKFVFNKYYLVYLLKHTWFAMLCTVISAAMLVLSKSLSVGHLLIGIALLIGSYLFSILHRKYEGLIMQWGYSDAYSKRKAAAAKYAVGSAALIYMFFAAF